MTRHFRKLLQLLMLLGIAFKQDVLVSPSPSVPGWLILTVLAKSHCVEF